MTVVASQLDGLAHEVAIEGGHGLIADEPADRGGGDRGPTPTQLLAASLASCTAITVQMYATRKGWDVQPLEVAVETAYEGPVPSAFEVSLALPDGLDAEQRRRLLRIAAKCPVHKAIAGATPVTVAERSEPRR